VDHALETARMAARVAERLALDADTSWRCIAAARLHDIGKLRVPDPVLRKPGPLTDDEWELVRRHPEAGAAIVGLRPALAELARAVREHHERYDGSGYPAGLAGEAICIEARVIGACDAWVTMRSDRPYSAALSVDDALAELRAGAGSQFDPSVVHALVDLVQGALEATT